MKTQNNQPVGFLQSFSDSREILPLIKEQTFRCITVPLDARIEDDISMYRTCIEEVKNASEGDVVEVIINTEGGSLQTALAIISALDQTDAEVAGIIEGMAASAGSLVALHCHNIHLNPYSTMFIHAESFGSVGKRHEVKTQVEFSLKWVEKIIRDTYKYFLTEEEINQVLEGRDFYFNADQILERLEIRSKALQEEHESQQDEESCEGNCEDCTCEFNEEELSALVNDLNLPA